MAGFENIAWLNSNEMTMIIRLIIAALYGGIVGIERGSGDRPAGFRTHILVCVGSALFMLVSIYGFDDLALGGADKALGDMGNRRDSARIAAQVVSGIGFLGAGTIMHEGVTVKGLTTAASLWMVSAIGLAVGAGMYVLGGVATIITMVTLVVFHNWEKHFNNTARSNRRYIKVIAANEAGSVTDITGFLTMNGIEVKSMHVKRNKLNNTIQVELYLKVPKEQNFMDVISGMKELDSVHSLESYN